MRNARFVQVAKSSSAIDYLNAELYQYIAAIKSNLFYENPTSRVKHPICYNDVLDEIAIKQTHQVAVAAFLGGDGIAQCHCLYARLQAYPFFK